MNRKYGRASIALFGVIMLLVLGLLGFFVFRRQAAVSRFTGEPLSYYSLGTQTVEIKSAPENVTAPDLPNNLIIKPGTYKVFGQSYNLTNEGLYRFLLPPKENEQRIVYDKDINALLSGIAWIYSHGDTDNRERNDKLEQKALQSKLIGTCGKISSFAQDILRDNRIESRIAMGLTRQDFNGFDDSHVLLEVKVDNAWRVYDLDNNAVFMRQGQYLNYLEFVAAVQTGDYEIKKIADDTNIAILGFKDDTGYDYSFYGEAKIGNEAELRQWYKRVIGTPFIKDDGLFYYWDGDEAKVKSFEKATIKISEPDFRNKFYPAK